MRALSTRNQEPSRTRIALCVGAVKLGRSWRAAARSRAIREMGTLSLLDALAYLELLAEVRPEKLERAAVRWHGRLETESATLTLAESQLAIAALASLCAGERDALTILRSVVRRARGRRCFRA
jgi:hypothetical protein